MNVLIAKQLAVTARTSERVRAFWTGTGWGSLSEGAEFVMRGGTLPDPDRVAANLHPEVIQYDATNDVAHGLFLVTLADPSTEPQLVVLWARSPGEARKQVMRAHPRASLIGCREIA